MKRINVVSSNIKSIGYENGILQVEFLNGSIYNYYNVPQVIYMHFINANSHGEYLWQNIRENYEYEKIN